MQLTKELKAARGRELCMLSQGLKLRQSVLPLLISFLFSHIGLALLSSPLSFTSSSRPFSSHIVLFFLSFLFSSSYLVSPFTLFLCLSLFISLYRLISVPWESARVICTTEREREKKHIFWVFILRFDCEFSWSIPIFFVLQIYFYPVDSDAFS